MAERELRSAVGDRGRVGGVRASEARGPGARRGAPSGWASGDDSGLIDLKALRSLDASRCAGEADAGGPVMIPVPHLQLFPFGAPEEPRPLLAAPPPPTALPEAPPPASRRPSRVRSAAQMMLGAALALAAVGIGYAAASLRAEAPVPSATAALASE
ncbi:hypothetical protein WMF18_15805 [Sorangium sp. So ce315]|uniref:hypothetical protein n=1 Tax=Sorangium sp. So ce315 TaxID=3133299 RepID=UPI003F60AF67